MIRIANAQLWVHDQDEALAFYTQKLGWEVRADVTLRRDGQLPLAHRRARRPAGRRRRADGHPRPARLRRRDDRAGRADLMAKGFAGTVFLTTDDCRASYEELKGRGVEFVDAPEERPYGIDSRLPRPVGQPPPPHPGARGGGGLNARPPVGPNRPLQMEGSARPARERATAPASLGWVTFDRQELELHGQRVSYRTAGSGPALLLLHGIANSSETWARVAPLLSERFTVIAPDLLGHGESATPRGDYSLGAHASGARDVAHRARPRARHRRRALARRRHRDAVRLPVPRAHRAPGAGVERRARPRGAPAAARRVAARRRLRAAGAHLARLVGLGRDARRPARRASGCTRAATSRCSRAASRSSTTPARARRSCTPCARSIEPGGQRVSAQRPARARRRAADADRLGRATTRSSRSSTAPAAHEAMPGSRFVVFPGAGHMPHDAEPERFAAVLTEFCEDDRAARG